MSFLERIPFMPKSEGKRELVFFFMLAGSIMLLGLIGGMTGLLYKDVPESTPAAIEATATVTEPTIEVTITPES